MLATTQEASNAFRDITSGVIGGIVSKIVEYPFDTVKVRLQSQSDHLPLRYKGPLDCIRQGYAKEGIRGFYRGVSVPLLGAAAENASLFWSYEVAKDAIRNSGILVTKGADDQDDDLPLGAKVVAGMASGAVTSVILTPIELVKCRMQVSSKSTAAANLKPLQIITQIYRSSGLQGFWRGHLGTFFRETGGTAAWFGGNEALLLYFRHRTARQQNRESIHDIRPTLAQQLTSGALAGVSYNFFLFPADTIKSKIQVDSSSGAHGMRFWSTGREIWRSSGVAGLYRGCGLTCLRSAPSSALIFTIVEKLKQGWPEAV
ncbi:hypothetical protein LTR62_002128 [Meristemomyces frigidus]|uniref:Amino-acid transporter arg-13 n=1 Tax=Meristemomyces frigidus TaxID=1508187 RepID=A0AAN7T8T3_9PEZI|nr:hypothetical protein LTR62_002128 [Meristemomyces frigidus]